jgi:hypothetical protein
VLQVFVCSPFGRFAPATVSEAQNRLPLLLKMLSCIAPPLVVGLRLLSRWRGRGSFMFIALGIGAG